MLSFRVVFHCNTVKMKKNKMKRNEETKNIVVEVEAGKMGVI